MEQTPPPSRPRLFRIAVFAAGILGVIIAAFLLFTLALCEDDWCDLFGRLSPRAAGNVNGTTNTTEPAPLVVTSPGLNAIVTSPLTVTGRAKGTWFFEASFPVSLLDATGATIATVAAQAQGEWMTLEPVEFLARIDFTAPWTDTGWLSFSPDDPRGDGTVESFKYPVRFR